MGNKWPMDHYWFGNIIEKINILPYVANRYYLYDLYISNDGENWIQIEHKTDQTIGTNEGDTYTYDDGLQARYLKLSGKYNSANESFHIKEIRVYGNEIEISKTALQIAVDTANTLKAQGALDNVVPAVAAEFEAALQEAADVLVDTGADQTTVDSAFYRLANAIHMLEFVKGDKSALEALINEAEKYEEGNYTTDSWTAFKEALDAARDVMNDENALESDVNKALNNLTEAIGNLVLRTDKTRLQEAYDMVDGLDKSLYTENSVAGLVDPMAAAKAVLDDPDATQAEVDAAYEALIRAYLDLRLIPNKDLLQGLINKAETLNATNYSAKTWSVMTKALDEAKAVFNDPEASQAEVDNAKEVLTKAMAGLEMIEASNPVKAGDTTASVATGDTTNMLYPLAGLAIAALAFYGTKKKKED